MQVARVRRYHHMLGNIETVPLLDGPQDDESLNKAGILPFIRSGKNALKFFVMQPVPQRPELGPPEFQIAKGTRRIRDGGQWWDITSRHLPIRDFSRVEDILTTALREGQEELGLRVDNILRLYRGRVFGFTSATTGKGKEMLVHAVEIRDPELFDPPEAESGSCPVCRWMTVEECQQAMRPDHFAVVAEFHRALAENGHL